MPKRPLGAAIRDRRRVRIMPSKTLVIHECRAHGTCSGLAPDQYFFSATGRLTLSQEEIEGEFLKANPWLKPNMIVVSCGGQNLRRAHLLRPRPAPKALRSE